MFSNCKTVYRHCIKIRKRKGTKKKMKILSKHKNHQSYNFSSYIYVVTIESFFFCHCDHSRSQGIHNFAICIIHLKHYCDFLSMQFNYFQWYHYVLSNRWIVIYSSYFLLFAISVVFKFLLL